MSKNTFYRIVWLAVAAACGITVLLSMTSCHAAPGTVGAVAAGGTAAVDAGLNSLVGNGVLDPNTGSFISGWAHLIQDTLANVTGLTAKLQTAQDAHAAQLAAVQAKIPTASDQTVQAGATALATFAAVRAHRGPATKAAAKPA